MSNREAFKTRWSRLKIVQILNSKVLRLSIAMSCINLDNCKNKKIMSIEG